MGLGPQDKKQVGLGRIKQKTATNLSSSQTLLNKPNLNLIWGRALRVQIWVKLGQFGPQAIVKNSGQIRIGLVRFIWPGMNIIFGEIGTYEQKLFNLYVTLTFNQRP